MDLNFTSWYFILVLVHSRDKVLSAMRGGISPENIYSHRQLLSGERCVTSRKTAAKEITVPTATFPYNFFISFVSIFFTFCFVI